MPHQVRASLLDSKTPPMTLWPPLGGVAPAPPGPQIPDPCRGHKRVRPLRSALEAAYKCTSNKSPNPVFGHTQRTSPDAPEVVEARMAKSPTLRRIQRMSDGTWSGR